MEQLLLKLTPHKGILKGETQLSNDEFLLKRRKDPTEDLFDKLWNEYFDKIAKRAKTLSRSLAIKEENLQKREEDTKSQENYYKEMEKRLTKVTYDLRRKQEDLEHYRTENKKIKREVENLKKRLKTKTTSKKQRKSRRRW